MTEKREVDHTNVFESYIAKEVFMMDVIEKIVNDWRRSERQFIHEWIGYSVETWLDEEFENDEDEEE